MENYRNTGDLNITQREIEILRKRMSNKLNILDTRIYGIWDTQLPSNVASP